MTREDFRQFKKEFTDFMVGIYAKYAKNDTDLLLIQSKIAEFCAINIYNHIRIDWIEEQNEQEEKSS